MFSIIARWRLFKKMGYKGWIFLIPFYSDFCMFEALYGNGWRYIQPLWVIPLIFGISALLSSTMRSFAMMVFGVLAAVIYVIYYVLSYIIRLTNSFDKDGWWILGTLLFYPVFIIIYGISDLSFNNTSYPDTNNYDAIDGFIDFFRSQNTIGKKNNGSNIHKRFCPSCGLPVSPDARFCNECGTPIEE